MPRSHFDIETLALLDTLSYAEDARQETEIMSAETRSLLDTICRDVDEIVENISGDFGDFAADLDEILQ